MKKQQKILPQPLRNQTSVRFWSFLQSDKSDVATALKQNDWMADVSYIDFDTGDDKLLTFIDGKKVLDLVEKYGLNTTEFKEAIKDKSLRQSVRAGRIARRLLPNLTLSAEAIEQFTNKVIAQKGGRIGFEMLQGDSIRYAYSGDTYARGGGTLNGSCMRYDSCQSFFDIYTENPNKVKMLALYSPTRRLLGRAIVWMDAAVHRGNEGTWEGVLMDRVYTVRDADVNKFIKYAEQEGWGYRTYTYAESSWCFTLPEDDEYVDYTGCNAEAELDTHEDDYSEYPYMDTMMYIDGYTVNNFNGNKKLRDTDGGYEDLDEDEPF